MEPNIPINMTAVLVAIVANFIFGAIWYMPLFGKAWAKEMKMDLNQKPPKSVMYRGMLIMVIGSFLMTYVFAHNIFVWNHFMTSPIPAMQNAWMAAFFTWLGFFLPQDLGRIAWEGSSWKLFFINTVHHFLSLFIVAIILCMMM